MRSIKAKNRQLWIAGVCLLLLLAGCGSKQTQEVQNTFVYEDDAKLPPKDTVIGGVVLGVEGNRITMTTSYEMIGEIKGGERVESTEAMDTQEDTSVEKGILTLSDASCLTKEVDGSEEQKADITEIEEGTLLSLTFDENGRITYIVIRSIYGM